MKRLLIIIVLLLSYTSTWAQSDTEFWFALPVMSYDTANTISQNIYFATYDSPADITVEFLYDDTTYTVNLNLGTFTYQGVPIPAMNDYPVMTPLRRSVHVTSNVPIDCCYDKTRPSGERYSLKGRTALGTNFLVPGQNYYPLVPGACPTAEIVATENNTDIQIYALVSLYGGIPAFTPVNVTLQQGECYAIAPDNNGDITRTQIHSSRPIAVNVSYPEVSVSYGETHSVDDLGEQLVPVNMLGSRYAAITKFSSESRIFIFPTDTNTSVTINGTDIGLTLNPGGFYNCLLDTDIDIHYIVADKPVAVFQTTIDQMTWNPPPPTNIGGTILPHLDCTGSRQASMFSYAPVNGTNVSFVGNGRYIYVICKTADTNSFYEICYHYVSHVRWLNFRPFPGDSTLSWGFSKTQWDSLLSFMNSTGKFILFGSEQSTRFNSFTCHTSYDSVSPSYLFFNSSQHIFCTGDSIRLPISRYGVDDLTLNGPNGLHLAVDADTVTLPADTTYSGTYYLSALDTLGCRADLLTDSITISVSESYNKTIFDTIIQNQLPWQRFGTSFTYDADTIIFRPGTDNACDSVTDYHLKVYFNHHDTVFYYICPDQLPVSYNTHTFDHEGDYDFIHSGSHGEDSVFTFSLHIIPSSDTTIYDTIVESQLPWYVFDTVFNDTVADYIYRTYNEAGCDSIVHYYLHIFWNGDHCDSSLTYPNVVTPNGDGLNDRFVIGGLLENQCFKYNELTIFSREGVPVYHKQNIASESDWWNPAAHHAPDGTYFFIFKGHGVNIHTMHKGVIEVLSE